jgi:hypothetical protein
LATYVYVVASTNLVIHPLIGITRQAHTLGAVRTTKESTSKPMISIELLFANLL